MLEKTNLLFGVTFGAGASSSDELSDEELAGLAAFTGFLVTFFALVATIFFTGSSSEEEPK